MRIIEQNLYFLQVKVQIWFGCPYGLFEVYLTYAMSDLACVQYG